MSQDPTRGGILALDLAAHTGWAYGPPEAAHPRAFGVWDLGSATRGGPGGVYAGLSDWLGDAFRLYRPGLVMMEAPLQPQAQTHAQTAYLLFGYCAVVDLLCYRWSIPLEKRAASTVRAKILGNGRAKKDEIVAWCRQQGHDINDHNAADAVVLWYFSKRAVPDKKWPS